MLEANTNNLTTGVSSGVPYVNDPDPQTVVLTRADVEEFRAIICETCGETISEQEAWNRATTLVALGRMLLGPLPDDPDAELTESSNIRSLALG
jgi:hypothetical protein